MLSDIQKRLIDLIGTERVSAYLEAAGAAFPFSNKPELQCVPSSEEQIAAIIQWATRHKISVVPMGSGTALGLGEAIPAHALLLRLEEMDKMIAYEPSDMVATAQAGMKLEQFQKAVGAHGQWLPIDAHPDATLGGLLNTNRSGPRRLLYGSLRDMVLGVRVVNGDGVVRKCGGQVVKNVTGYALEKLYIGSLGSLGVITEITFKLRPIPESRTVFQLRAPSFESGFGLARWMIERFPVAAAVSAWPHRNVSALLAMEGAQYDIQRMASELEKAASSFHVQVERTELPAIPPEPWPVHLRVWPEESGTHASEALQARLSWPVRSNDFLPHAQRLSVQAQKNGFSRVRAFFDFSGTAHMELLVSATSDSPAWGNLNSVVMPMRNEKIPMTVTWRHPSSGSEPPAFGPPRSDWRIMEGIKRTLDPEGILNTGRFVGGL